MPEHTTAGFSIQEGTLTLSADCTAAERLLLQELQKEASNLKHIDVSPDNPQYTSADGMLLNKDGSKLLRCPCGKSSVKIPESVRIIGNSAFENCSRLQSLTLPPQTEKIGIRAFNGCSSLQRIHLSENIQSIGSEAFKGCSSLRKLHLPAGISVLKAQTFADCPCLEELHLPESLDTMESLCITASDKALKKLYLPKMLQHIAEDAFQTSTVLETVRVHADNPYFFEKDGLLYNNDMTKVLFCSRSRERSVGLPYRISVIESHAFAGCSQILAVTLPDSRCRIYDAAFAGCSMLHTITIQQTPSYVAKTAFDGCTRLQTMKTKNASVSLIPQDRIFAADTLMYAFDMLVCPDYAKHLPESIRYTAAVSFYMQKLPYADDFIRKRVTNMGRYAVQQNRTDILKFLTEQNILKKVQTEKLIAAAKQVQNQTALQLLQNYQQKNMQPEIQKPEPVRRSKYQRRRKI